MLTIKWIYDVPGGTAERIFQAEEAGVAFRTNHELSKIKPVPFIPHVFNRDVHNALFVVGHPHDLGNHSLAFGKVYVMNEAGRTVASYDLGKEADYHEAATVQPPGVGTVSNDTPKPMYKASGLM